MVAPAKDIPRTGARKPAADDINARAAADGDSRNLVDDQTAAAAVIDADEANAVAAQAVAQAAAEAGILPGEAPLASIGELAQAPAPAASEAAPAPAPATTPPPVEGEAAPVSPWIIGGAALVGVGVIAAIANDDDDDGPSAPPPDVPPPEPPPVPPPEPPANVAPTSPATLPVALEADGNTALSQANFPFADDDQGDTLTTVRITGITPTPVDLTAQPELRVDATTNHGYELVAGAVTWEAARDLAAARGGYLAILDTAPELTQANDHYLLSTDTTGATGTWIGASQTPGSASPDAGWTWLNGTPLAADSASPLWNNVAMGFNEPNDGDGGGETGLEDFAAVYEGVGSNLIYDAGSGITETQSGYLIEYDTAVASPLTLNGAAVIVGQDIAVADLAGLSWNSVFNTGGTVTFQVGDNDGAFSADNTLTFTSPAPPVTAAPPTMIAIEDQHLNVLA